MFNGFRRGGSLVVAFVVFLALASPGVVTPRAAASQLALEMRLADEELNNVYHQALDNMPNDRTRAALREAQRNWVAFLESEVALNAASYTDNKGGRFIRLELTQTRVKQLRAIASGRSSTGYGDGN